MKYLITLAAVVAMSARPLYAITLADKGFPEFGDIKIETAGDITVPVVGAPVRQEKSSDITDIGAAGKSITGDNDYSFDIPVDNIGNITEVLDSQNNFLVRVTRNGYGDYAAELMIGGNSAAFSIRKVDADRYLVRSDDVNLTVTHNFFGNYYDISGDIPTPIGETLTLRLNVDAFGAMTASDSGYDLSLRQDRVSGRIDSSVFSEANAACVIALSMAIRRDANQQDPDWHPYNPDPWNPSPYHPDPYHPNPWHPQPGPHPQPPHPQPGPNPQPPHPQPGPNPQPPHPQPGPNPQPPHPNTQPGNSAGRRSRCCR